MSTSDATGGPDGDGRIRVGVVGLGIGRMHVLACKELRDRYQIVAVCDTDRGRAEEVAGWLRGVRATTDPAEVFDAPDIDVVAICTPPFEHRAQVEAALRAGKDVVCEKPLVGSVTELDDLAAVAEETGRTLMPILQYRFGHGIQKVRHLVQAGLTGRPFVANVDVAWLRGDDYYSVPWRGRAETELGGVLLSHALHAIDMAVFVLGRPVAVWARTSTLVNDVEVEDCAVATMRWRDGSLATLSATLGSAAEISRHRFTFEHLSAESGTDPYANGGDPWVITPTLDEHGERVEAALAGLTLGGEDYVGQYERFAATRAAGQEPPVTVLDARAVIEVVAAMYESAREGHEVALPLDPDDPAMAGWA